jgi:hypothetical protein
VREGGRERAREIGSPVVLACYVALDVLHYMHSSRCVHEDVLH